MTRLFPFRTAQATTLILIQGSEKTALIDAVESDLFGELEKQLKNIPKLDYIISLHAEQDHSGCIPQVLFKYPNAKLITSVKAKNILMDLLYIPEKSIVTIKDGESLSLGDKTLEFVYSPWAHWPETMSAYLKEDKILFSCDLFASHIATTDLFVTDEARIYEAAKRYYAEIMMPFSSIIKKNIERIEKYEIDMIAPSHGPIYPHPSFIIDAHKEWINGPLKNKAVIPYVSMHKSTKKMVDYFVSSLVKRGVNAELFDLLTD